MKGYGFSDLGDGKGVQRFEVEIVGLLKSYAPKQDLILARVTGGALDKTGIIAGMSGSPIYVDGKLIGALAYGWPFSREPICGITPIQSMLDIRKAPAAPPVPIGGAATRAAAFVSAFRDRPFAAPLRGAARAAQGRAVVGGPVALAAAGLPLGRPLPGPPLRGSGGGGRLARRPVGRLGAGGGRNGSVDRLRPPASSRARRSRPCCCRATWCSRPPGP